ncbi:MAG TPA: hypothetical protein VGQ87_00855 [Patescibacteria group bacterium]|jgi:plastocyanin|nr:hypothetical protein [Patescibacteria group bacterium]
MKNYKFVVLGLVIVVLGLAILNKDKFKRQENSENTNETSGFFISKSDIKPDDTVVSENDKDGFVPAEITVKKGRRVVFVNDTTTYNWPASNLHPTHEIYPEFDPKQPIDSGKAWAFVFDKVGEWGYHDHLMPNRRGIIKVTQE